MASTSPHWSHSLSNGTMVPPTSSILVLPYAFRDYHQAQSSEARCVGLLTMPALRHSRKPPLNPESGHQSGLVARWLSACSNIMATSSKGLTYGIRHIPEAMYALPGLKAAPDNATSRHATRSVAGLVLTNVTATAATIAGSARVPTYSCGQHAKSDLDRLFSWLLI